MAFAINEFTQRLAGDGARPNLFQVVMVLPGVGPRQLSFFAKSAQLPGSTLGIVPIFYQGREVKFAGNRTFADWTITIINGEDFSIRNSFERWMNGINTHETNKRDMGGVNLIQSTVLPIPTASNYITDAVVNQYGKNDTIKKSYNFVGMFPVDLSPIDLDWGTNDTIEEFTVTFAYQYWTTGENSAVNGITS
jgi:hypothetical protein